MGSDLDYRSYIFFLLSCIKILLALLTFSRYDVVIDATDNPPSRYLLNDACVLAKKPLIYGGALRFEGQVVYIIFHGLIILKWLLSILGERDQSKISWCNIQEEAKE